MRVLIVDDEKPARQRFRRLIEGFDGIEIIAEGSNGVEAIALVVKHQPDVVFLDIEMPELSGLEAAAAIVELKSLVVFVTAFDQFAVQAFEKNAVDYLVKPVEKERLRSTVERLKSLSGGGKGSPNLPGVIDSFAKERVLKRLAVRGAKKIEVIDFSEISLIKSTDGYAEVFHGVKKSLSEESLDAIARKIDGRFVRVHRSAVVNLDFVQELVREGDRKYTAKLKDHYENEVSISRDALKEVQERLGL